MCSVLVDFRAMICGVSVDLEAVIIAIRYHTHSNQHEKLQGFRAGQNTALTTAQTQHCTAKACS